jgi:hypothetical protein
MSRLSAFAAAALLACFALPAPATPQDQANETIEIVLADLDPPAVFTLLRTIVGSKRLAEVEEGTIQVTDTADRLALAEKVVEMVGAAGGDPPATVTYEVGDETVVAVVPVAHVPLREAMSALRRQQRIARIVTQETRSLLVLRDTREQIDAALELIATLDRPPAE